MKVRRDYKAEFLQQLALARLPQPISEHRFAPPRRWRFDFAYLEQKVAIEYEGGIYFQRNEEGRGHQTIKNFEANAEKYNEAALRGWRLIRITAGMVRNGQALGFVERALNGG